MRILCGTDFSLHAAEAANVAAMMAGRLNETLVIMHVIENAEGGSVTPQSYDSPSGNVQERLHAEAERLRKLGPPAVKEELVIGSTYEKLVDAGHFSSTRLIVVSSLGLIAPSRFLVGSVAERTAERSPAPTLVVRGSASFESWMRGERPLKVVVCYDFSASSDSALCWIKELSAMGPCDVTVAYVAWPPEESERLGIGNPLSPDERQAEIHALLERNLKQKAIPMLGEENVHIRVISCWGRPDYPLIDLVAELKADLIVVGTHQRQGFSRFRLGSVSRAILHHSPTSVAVVPSSRRVAQDVEHLPEFRNALVTTDFSDLGNRAIPYAYSALSRGGNVCLLHVAPPSGKAAGGTAQNDSLKLQLNRLIPSDAESQGIRTQIEVVEDREPALAICQAAERFNADLICLASHGRSGLSKTVLGSVAHTVMTHSTRPLLMLRPPKE